MTTTCVTRPSPPEAFSSSEATLMRLYSPDGLRLHTGAGGQVAGKFK